MFRKTVVVRYKPPTVSNSIIQNDGKEGIGTTSNVPPAVVSNSVVNYEEGKEEREEAEAKRKIHSDEVWQEIYQRLELEVKHYLRDIAIKRGKHVEYMVHVTPLVREPYLIVVKGALVPEIHVSERLAMKVAVEYADKIWSGRNYLRSILREAYECALRVKKTLTKPVLRADYLVLRDDLQKFCWGHGNEQKYLRYVDSRLFQHTVEYVVTITDPVTGVSRTLTGEDLGSTRNQAVRDLQMLIGESDDLYALYDAHVRRRIAPKDSPEAIGIINHSETEKHQQQFFGGDSLPLNYDSNSNPDEEKENSNE